MKHLFTLALFVVANSISAQWIQQTSGTTADLTSVHFTDAQNGWISGDDGKILHTSNGGTNWSAQVSGTTKDLNCIYFSDNLNGWSAGKDGIIKHTSDGGASWTSQTSGTVFDLNAIHFFDSQNGFAVGETGVILKTVNGGTNWTISLAGNGGSGSGSDESDLELLSVQVVSATTAYVCGTSGYFAKTTNAGANWIVQTSGVSEDFESLYFTSESNGYIAYKAGKVKKTNGNGTFTSVYAATSKDLNGIWFINENRGWVCGDEGRLLFTPNGGTSWTSHNISAVTHDLYDIQFPTPNVGYSVGKKGTILKLSNGEQLGLNEKNDQISVIISPNPATDLLSISFDENGEKSILVTDLNGKIFAKTISTEQSVILETSNWPAGIYPVQIQTSNGSATTKLIKL